MVTFAIVVWLAHTLSCIQNVLSQALNGQMRLAAARAHTLQVIASE